MPLGRRLLRGTREARTGGYSDRRLVDIIILVEHVDRELDVACLIAAQLNHIAPHLTVQIANFYTEAQHLIATIDPKVVVTPFFYAAHDPAMRDYVEAWSQAAFFNMAWEQILYGAQKTLKKPRDDFSRYRVRHLAWSREFRDYLIAHSVSAENIAFLGHPLFDLYTPTMRDYFTGRREIAARHGLDPSKRWVFFPENFRWAFLSSERFDALTDSGISRETLDAQKSYCIKALAESAKWLAWLAAEGADVIILRPRPAVTTRLMREFVENALGDAPASFHIIKDLSVREWILASDVVVSSISTSLIEAAVAGKPVLRIEPFPTPPSMRYDWCELICTAETPDRFRALIGGDAVVSSSARLREWAIHALGVGDAPTASIAHEIVRMSASEPAARKAPTARRPSARSRLLELVALAPPKLRHRLRARLQPGYFFNIETHEKDLFRNADARRRTLAFRLLLAQSG